MNPDLPDPTLLAGDDGAANLVMAVIVLAVTGALAALFLGVRGFLERGRERLERRLRSDDSIPDILLVDRLHAEANKPKGLADRLDQAWVGMIERTGLQIGPDQALGLIGLSGVSLAAVLYLWRGEPWLAVVGLLIGLALPLGTFLFLQGRWRKQLQEQLPDAMFFLARSLRAGLSLEQALAMVGEEGPMPLADELRRCSEQLKLGLAAPAALQLTARRLQLQDFHVFVAIVTLHRSIGGNLTLLLDRLASSTRDRNQYVGYFRSATAMGRITAIAIGSAVPLIFLGYSLFEPDYATRFFDSTAGIVALSVAFGLELVGAAWLFYLLRSDY
jgi:tight adherence protein B